MLIATFLAFIMIVGTSGAFAVEGDGTTQSAGSTNSGTDVMSGSGSTGTCSTNTCSTETCSTDTPEASSAPAAAGKPVTPSMKAYWMRWDSVAGASGSDLSSRGITDIFVLTRSVSGAYYFNEMNNAVAKFSPYGIKVHAWFVCFKNGGSFVNPSGYYSYTVPVYLYTTKHWGKKAIAYKVKKRVKWYKVGKRWKYRTTYITKYRYRKGWIYTPIYRYDAYSGYNTAYNDELIGQIKNINDNSGVDGVHLDYVRYSGVASSGNAAWQQPGGAAAAIDTVTGFVQKARGVVTKQLSAAVMPEGSSNGYTYGQEYSRLAPFLDFIVPMTYEGNYNANNDWIKSKTQYIVGQSGTTPVVSGFTTYWSDSNLAPVSDADLQGNVDDARSVGAKGFALFRYGFGNSYIPA